MKNKILIFMILVIFLLLLNSCKEKHIQIDEENHDYKSDTISSIKNKGVIVDMKYFRTLVIKTKNDIVVEEVDRNIFKYLSIGDTIK